MKLLVLGEFSSVAEHEIGSVAKSAHELAQGGFAVPYGLVLPRSAMEEFLVETGMIGQFFAHLKKGHPEKAAALVTSTPMPEEMQEALVRELDGHAMKIFDVHGSALSRGPEFHCYGQRRTHIGHVVRASWAACLSTEQPFSAVVLTKHVGADKIGKIYTQHPLNNSKAHCVITLARPQNSVFFIETNSGAVANAKDFHRIDGPLLVAEKDMLIQLVRQAQSFSHKPLVMDWILGDGAYVLSYRELSGDDRAEFLRQSGN